MRLSTFFLLYIYIVVFSSSFSVNAQNSPPSQYKDAPGELRFPTEEQLFKDDPDPVVLSAQIAVRLKKIQRTISLDYNEHVQKYISYNLNPARKEHVEKMLARSKKFFPVFEPILAKYGVPDEMKYLAVIESALNPFATSRMGATGPWQFMYSTGLRYNLNISKRVDERRDPYLACDAASRYLKEMYDFYGSWQLAIASYNCGAGNVNRAIKKAGGSKNFWDIRMYLPAETRAYVPIYIAMVYTMKYAEKYKIYPLKLEKEETQRVTARQKLTVTDLERALEIPRQVIIDENPSLLTTIIPEDFILNLPSSKIIAFNQMQDSLYLAAQNANAEQKLNIPNVIIPDCPSIDDNCTEPLAKNEDFSGKPIVKNNLPKTENNIPEEDESFYQKVKNVFTSSDKKEEDKTIANKSISTKTKTFDDWKKIPVAVEPKTNPKNTEPSAKESNSGQLKEDNSAYKTIAYSVKKNDNLGNIASWFHCNVKEIKRWNNLNGNNINIGDELLIYVHKNDLKKFVRFNYLSNNVKDDLSRKITTQEEANEAEKAKEQNDKTPLIDKINPVKILSKKECFQYYKIKEGENLWTIAQKYDEVTVQDLMLWNGFKKTPVLHKGDEIKVRKIKCK
jgi:membrane-bound lytic murein transglycosylase D